MQTKVQKWGNSLAVRIPKSFAAEVQLGQDAVVEISLQDNNIVITPIPAPSFTLDELLAGVTDDNIHGAIDTGDTVGREVW
ncbi:MAG: AbrB/MazE/SpoVT family DNA-binding domain-containing protein [Abitibacteriaceae bacterium]|nr:AbrB/MazE/SpoVT family DNA-binding domain-containing protein [Abditibacteriaceae bacterium]